MKKAKQKSFSHRSEKGPTTLGGTARRRCKHIVGVSLLWYVAVLLQLASTSLGAESVTQFDETFRWASTNMVLRQTIELSDSQRSGRNTGDRRPLRDNAYNFHFDSFGAPPPFDFLAKLEPSGSESVEIESQNIKFKKYGRTVPLNRSLVPDWADPAKPYAVSTPFLDKVVIVYPYYFYQCKENKYFAELYSLEGNLVQTFDSLPTHVALNNPNLLISPERSGCCESIRWDFRFYNITQKTMTQLFCPEGFCGDVLFEFIDQHEHYLLIQEIVDSVSGVGTYLQTNIYLIDKQGNLTASGRVIFATKNNQSNKDNISTVEPFSLNNLESVDRINNGKSWLLQYKTGNEYSTAQITGRTDGVSPTALFLLANERVASHQKAGIKIDSYKVKELPSLLIATPGKYLITGRSVKGIEIGKEFEVKPHTINKLPIEF